MTPSHYKISFGHVEKVLKEFGLFRMRGVKNLSVDGVSDDFKLASIKDKYFKAYSTGLLNYDYDFLLEDQSFFQFEYRVCENLEIRYSFFQNPIEYISYKDYLLEQIDTHAFSEPIEEIGLLLESEYQQFLDEQEFVSNYSTFRYDFDADNYKPIIHSVSHFHIGHLNHVRVPLDKVISPLKFVLFTIKHVYYNQWKNMVESEGDFILKCLKQACEGESVLDKDKWNELEELEIYMK